jgi:hypothetical protein
MAGQRAWIHRTARWSLEPNSGIAIALRKGQGGITMLNETDTTAGTPQPQDESSDTQKTLQERLNQIANKAAKRVANRVQRYDEEHGLFTK